MLTDKGLHVQVHTHGSSCVVACPPSLLLSSVAGFSSPHAPSLHLFRPCRRASTRTWGGFLCPPTA
jgi:hypothetical protein